MRLAHKTARHARVSTQLDVARSEPNLFTQTILRCTKLPLSACSEHKRKTDDLVQETLECA